ncbi:MAG: DNA polymerase/3'-5' exonuclease PolX [Chitinophagales bacterium]|nr:DNA polymerase/3'-5' exonuclease PolX [Chitinophagales bacterium]
MTNKQIALAFDELANLMELHEEDSFRIKSYASAYLTLRKLDSSLAEMSDTEIKAIKGVGPAIAAKIRELLETGKMDTLEKFREKTPVGVREMLEIGGFGPKKVRQVWQEMGLESPGELWYACNENRLIEYKGFGLKTQEDLKNKLDYFFRSRGKMHLDTALAEAEAACQLLQNEVSGAMAEPVGEVRRRCQVVESVEVLTTVDPTQLKLPEGGEFGRETGDNGEVYLRRGEGARVRVISCQPAEWGSKLFRYTGSAGFLEGFVQAHPGLDFKGLEQESQVFDKAQAAFVAPELRESASTLQSGTPTGLITDTDIRGILHVHSTWSDGLHSLREMCEYTRSLGYAYIGMTDHSQSAFYANGLKPDRVLAQMDEIDRLNEELAPFKIYKGIESDILNDGSLDYEDTLLERFDFVIASVHSNLRMTQEKATERILRAIEHPCTTILGHPTGRLLLSREGYPLDWDAIMEACAKHKVTIELNAHPRRLDIDWSLIPKAMAMGIKISINPDAHSRDGVLHTRFGVMLARKGGLTAEACLNAGLGIFK